MRVEGAGGRSRDLGVLALAVIAPLWGYSWVASKVALDYAKPFTFAVLSTFICVACLFAALVVTRRGVVMEVEPGLADGDDLRVRAQLPELLQQGLGQVLGVVRMEAHGGVAAVVGLSDLDRAAARGHVEADIDDDLHIRQPGALERLLEVIVEAFVVKVSVGVYQHDEW